MKKITLFIIVIAHLIYAKTHQYPQGWDELQNNQNWKLIKETDRIKIFSKKISVSPLPAYRAELISILDNESLIRTAWNVENSQEIFPNAYIVDAGIYNHNGNKAYTAFQVFDIPLLAPRLYQFNSIRLDNSVHWAKTDTIDNPQKVLLPPVNFGSWQVEKSDDKSKLIYRLCTNPGGYVPRWIVKQANQHYLPQMLIDFESYATKNKID